MQHQIQDNQQVIQQQESSDSSSYRLLQKKYLCHQCIQTFRKMVSVSKDQQISCPTCEQQFCEEIPDSPSVPDENPLSIYGQSAPSAIQRLQSSNYNSPVRSNSVQPNNQSSMRSQEANLGQNLTQVQSTQQSSSSSNQSPIQGITSTNGRIVRRTVTDRLGNQTITEEFYRGSESTPFRTTQHQVIRSPVILGQERQNHPIINDQQTEHTQHRPTQNAFIFLQENVNPVSSLFGLDGIIFSSSNNMNFRSNFDDQLLNLIIRLSEQDRGRTGNPPASKDAVQNLQEIKVTEKHCKKDEKTGQIEYPCCPICHEDLKEKAIILPCGHLYNKECIGEWLSQHNQCPVCRYELPTDDPEYEIRRQTSQQNHDEQAQQNLSI